MNKLTNPFTNPFTKPLTKLEEMQTDQFIIAQKVEELERQREYKRWLQALRNQLKEEQERERKRVEFMKKLPQTTLPPTKSRARSKMTRRSRSNSMSPYKSRSSTRSNTRSKPYSALF